VDGPQCACTQAVVLVGGEGTRLRPVTSRLPKPILPLVGRPFVGYILENLARHGVERAVFSSGYLSDAIRQTIGDGDAYGISVRYVVEDQPLGTAGAIRNARSELSGRRLLAFNGDVLTDVDVSALAEFHVDKGAAATILLTPVEDPRRYGLVRLRADDSVAEFLEKPGSENVGPGLINAGVYALEPEVLEMIPPGRAVSIERDVFPRLAADGRLFGYVSNAYWRDIGTPDSYLSAHFDLLQNALATHVADELGEHYVYLSPAATVAPGARIVPPAHIAAGVEVAPRAVVGPLAVLGEGCRVGEGATVVESVLQDRVRVGSDAVIERSIVVGGCEIGQRTHLSHAVLGEGCRVGADNVLAHGVCLFPDTELADGSMKFREIDGGEAR
jgi:mannose-1-phosphate guanylyltransferase